MLRVKAQTKSNIHVATNLIAALPVWASLPSVLIFFNLPIVAIIFLTLIWFFITGRVVDRYIPAMINPIIEKVFICDKG